MTMLMKGNKMTFLELAKKRYTSRVFMPKPVSDEKIKIILESARVAPTLGNTQSVRIIVIEEREDLRKLKLLLVTHDAPHVLLICGDMRKSFKYPAENIDSALSDATVAATHIILAAADVDIGSFWTMNFSPSKVKSAFDLPPSYQVFHIIGIGTPVDKKSPTRHGLERLPLNNMVTFLNKKDS